MKKYVLILGFGLLATGAVTAAMLEKNTDKKVKKEKKVEKKKQCTKVKTYCFFS